MSKLTTVKRILCFGDSLTEGYYHGGVKFHPYTLQLANLFKQMTESGEIEEVQLVNKGRSGELVHPEMAKRLPQILKDDGPYDLVIILGGTNDLASLKEAKQFDLFEKIKSLHKMAHEIGMKTCAVTIPQTAFDVLPISYEYVEYRESVNNQIRDFASNNSAMVCLCDVSLKIPMYGVRNNELASHWDDELHFTPKGYDRMGELIFEVIKNFI